MATETETTPEARRLCASPIIDVFDDLLAPGECAHLVELARPYMRRSQVSGESGGKLSPGRTSARAWLKHGLDPTVHAVASRIAGDALDIATLLPPLKDGNPKRGNAGIALAAVLGVTALDLLAFVRLRTA